MRQKIREFKNSLFFVAKFLACARLFPKQNSYMSDRLSAGQPAYETQLHAPRLRTGNNGGEVQK
jgi:hypothetical protein